MNDELNNQITEELKSAYIYLAMSAYFEDQDLPGFAQWMKVQSGEELEHAMKFFDFINEREGRVELQNIDKPEGSWSSPKAAFEAAYEHEKYISACIDGLVKTAREEEDNATANFLQWYVSEQVEEEANAIAIVKNLELIGDAKHGLFMLNRELGERKGD